MTKLFRRNLDEDGIKYLNDRLKHGCVISQALLEIHGNVETAYTPLPSGMHGGVLEFEAGGITNQHATMEWFISDVATRFPAKPEFSFVVEDSWATPEDISKYQGKARAFLSGTTVMYGIDGTEFDKNGLDRIIRSVNSFSYTGFITTWRLPDSKASPLLLDHETILDIARQTKLVLVNAFDQEGIVISEVGPCRERRRV